MQPPAILVYIMHSKDLNGFATGATKFFSRIEPRRNLL